MLRRETIIALRARHSAFRVAADLVFPPQAPPEMPVLEAMKPPPPLPTPEEAAAFVAGADARREWVAQVKRRCERNYDRRHNVPAIVLAAWMVLCVVLLVVAGVLAPEAPPPTPGPPAPPPTLTK